MMKLVPDLDVSPAVVAVLVAVWLSLSSSAGHAQQDDGGGEPPDPQAAAPADTTDLKAQLDDTTRSCVTAFEDAQRLRRQGKLVASRDQLLICANRNCPALLSDKCIPWLGQLDALLPSVIVSATDPQGNDTSAVRISMDGAEISAALDGRPMTIDPGLHQFRFELDGAKPIHKRLLIVQRHQGRRIDLVFKPVDAPPEPRAATEVPTAEPLTGLSALTYTGLAVGSAAFVVGTVTGVVAIVKADKLKERCSGALCPDTAQGDFDDGIGFAHASTVSFVVAAVGFGVALVAWSLDDDAAGKVDALGLRPSLGLGSVGLEGSF